MELIDKDTVVAEIKKRINYYQTKNQKWGVAWYAGRVAEGEGILDYINTLKVKDVDLEKIIEQTYHDRSVTDTSDIDYVDYENIAQYFFELGLKTLKGE